LRFVALRSIERASKFALWESLAVLRIAKESVMAPVMKVVMRWEDDKPELKTVLKMKLPRKWKDGPTLNLKKTFVESFNEKHPDVPLALDQVSE
jgi:hypothetical protein